MWHFLRGWSSAFNSTCLRSHTRFQLLLLPCIELFIVGLSGSQIREQRPSQSFSEMGAQRNHHFRNIPSRIQPMICQHRDGYSLLSPIVSRNAPGHARLVEKREWRGVVGPSLNESVQDSFVSFPVPTLRSNEG